MGNIRKFIASNPIFDKMIPKSFKTTSEKLTADRSKESISFLNGSRITILSADVKNKLAAGQTLMGRGCFEYNQLVATDIGELKIGDIVTQKIQCNIFSYNKKTKEIELKPIIEWFTNDRDNRDMYEVETTDGNKFIATEDHPVYVLNKGWVKVIDLKEDDEVLEVNIK